MAYFELTTWKHSAEPYAGKHQVLAVITCPSCKKEWILSGKVHQVSLDGTVIPSVICPLPECNFHAFVVLKEWVFPDWFMSKTMESFVADVVNNQKGSQ